MRNDKVDHPRKGSKDLSDAVCGAIYNAVAHTPRNFDQEVKIYNYSNYKSEEEEMEEERQRYEPGVIRPPHGSPMPDNLLAFMDSFADVDEGQKFVDNFTIL